MHTRVPRAAAGYAKLATAQAVKSATVVRHWVWWPGALPHRPAHRSRSPTTSYGALQQARGCKAALARRAAPQPAMYQALSMSACRPLSERGTLLRCRAVPGRMQQATPLVRRAVARRTIGRRRAATRAGAGNARCRCWFGTPSPSTNFGGCPGICKSAAALDSQGASGKSVCDNLWAAA